MSAEKLEVDISHGMCLSLRFAVDTRNRSDGRSINSSGFRFRGGEWKLGYAKFEEFHALSLGKCSGVNPNPLQVSVMVESFKSGRIVDVLPQVTRFTHEFWKTNKWHRIWWREEEEILGSVPEFRLQRVLKLIVVLKVVGDSTSYIPCLESLSEDFAMLLDQGPNPDVKFQCGGQSTKAHGAVVSARSQVIAKMLATDMVEGRTKVVKIPNMRPNVFEKFLRYLYTGKLDGLTFEVALNLFEAGDQYAVTGLAKRCSEYLVKHLSLQNACEVLVIADAHSDEGLVEKVVEYMVDKRVPVACEAWPAFCDEHPRLANKVLNHGWKALVK